MFGDVCTRLGIAACLIAAALAFVPQDAASRPVAGRLLLRSTPGLAAVFAGDRFVGMTSAGAADLALDLPAGTHEFAVCAPGHGDRFFRHDVVAGEEVAIAVELVQGDAPQANLDFIPLIGIGRVVRAAFDAGDPPDRYFRMRGVKGERRMLVFQTSGVVPRLIDAAGREYPMRLVERVMPLAGVGFLEFAFPFDGELGLQIGVIETARPWPLIFRVMAPPRPWSTDPPGPDRRRS